MSGSRDAAIVGQQLIVQQRHLAGYRALLELAVGFDMPARELDRLRREVIETENAVQHLRHEQRRLT